MTVVGSTTTTYVGNYLEWKGSTTTMKKYYYASGQRVALRQGSSTLYFLLTDHLGSTAITATTSGSKLAELRYYPWGGTRYSSGTTPTSYRYTGQREAEVGLYYYGARFYDPQLGRFVSPDSIIPLQQGSQAWDRYAYVNNNPLRFLDPTGHECYEVGSNTICTDDPDSYQELGISPVLGIPKPTFFDCAPQAGKPCVTPGMDPLIQLAHVIFGEGGSSLHQAGVNVTQTILNRAYNYWTCWENNCQHSWINPHHIPWEQITEDQLLALLLFIVSEPYLGKDGVLYPVYNAWGAPYPHPQTGESGGLFSLPLSACWEILWIILV